jgi:hypothetical protein
VILILIGTNTYLRVSHPPKNNISWDTYGYYLYLPAAFIYNDLGIKNKAVFEELNNKYHSTNTFYQFSYSQKGNFIMKYTMGMAILYSPAFLMGHAVALNTAYPADGFSSPYQWALIANGILFFIIGLFVLRKVLLRFFSDLVVAIILLIIYFGTNYFAYSTFNSEMPHTYLFTAYALILWFTIRWHETFNIRYIVGLAITIGLSTLSRPTELIAVIIPLLWHVEGWNSLKKKIKDLWHQHRVHMLVFIAILALIGSFQVIYWKIYSGQTIYYSYRNPGEGFEFLWPYTLKFLFSFRKGWLIYTPVMVFAIYGLFLLYRKNRSIFFSVFIFSIINLYIVSSWSCWWYAQSFGQRAMIQSYAVLSVPLGYSIVKIAGLNNFKKILLSLIIATLLFFNLFQYWQLKKNILSPDLMTYDYYVKTFGKTKVNPEYKELLLIDRGSYENKAMPEDKNLIGTTVFSLDFESTNETFSKHLSDSIYRSGLYSLKMDSTLRFSPSFKSTYEDLTDKEYAWVRVTVWVYPVHELSSTPVSITTTFQHKGGNYKYRGLNLNRKDQVSNIKLNQWNKVTMDYLTPEVRSKNDLLIVYLWNQGDLDIYFDDLVIEVFD